MVPESNPSPAPTPRQLTARTAAVTAGGQIGARAAGLVLTAASTAIVTRAIGREEFADWGTIMLLATMVAFMLDPGLSPVVVRRLGQAPQDVPRPGSLLRVRMAAALVAYVLVLLLVLGLRGSGALLLGAVLAAQLLPRAVVLNVGTWLQAEHRLHIQAGYEALTLAGGVAAMGAAALAGASSWLLALLGVVAPLVVLAGLMRRQLPGSAAPGDPDERLRVRAVIREALPLAGAIVLVSLYTRVGIFFVNAADSGRVADFALAFLFVEQLFVVAAIVAATLLPLLAPRAAEPAPAAAPIIQDSFAGVSALGGLGALVMIASAVPLVTALGGEEFGSAAKLVELLAPAGVVLLANVYLAYLFVACRRALLYLRYNVAGLAVSIALGLTLTVPYGAEAAARATWLTELVVVTLAAVPFFWRAPGGAFVLARFLLTLAVTVACAELVAAGVVAPVAGAVVGLAVLLALSAAQLPRWARYLRGGAVPATGS